MPEPDSSTGLADLFWASVLGGLTASTATTLGDICRITDSKRSPSCCDESALAGGGGALLVWATALLPCWKIPLAMKLPAKAHAPQKRRDNARFIGTTSRPYWTAGLGVPTDVAGNGLPANAFQSMQMSRSEREGKAAAALR